MRSYFQFLKSITLLLILSSLFTSQVLAVEVNKYLSHHLNETSVEITTSQGKLTLKTHNNNAIEAHYHFNNKNNPAAFLPSYAIKENAQLRTFGIKESTNELILTTDKLTAVITKSPFNIRYFKGDALLLSEEAGFFTGTVKENENQYTVQGFRFNLSENEKLLGGGERVLGMDRRGHRLPLYNKAHYGYETQSNQMNFSLPAVFSSKKYILLFDNSAKGWMDLGKTEQNIMQFEAVSGRMSYLVFAGDTYPELINNYVDVTGKQPMPPRWALGNYASRFGYRNEKEVRETVNKFIDLDIPLDALILDLYWFGKDIKGHMGNLSWDNEAFPNPEKMISDINKQGVNTILITEPFILTNSKKWSDAKQNQALAKDSVGLPKRFDFYFGNTSLVDVFNPKGTDWFNNIYKTLYQQGVSGWWGDLGEPEVHPSDTLHTLDDGSVVDSTFDGDAAAFEFGDGNLPEGFETLLIGMKAGDKGQWDVPPEKAFGMPNPNNQQAMLRSEFPDDMELAEGLVVSFADANKSELPGVVAELNDDEVVIDFNHPLAGKTLHFEVQVLSVTALGEES